MGLHITAISNIAVKGTDPELYEFNSLLELEEIKMMCINLNYIDRVSEYITSRSDTHIDIIHTYESETVSFSAGRYSSYNEFRNILSAAILGVEADIVWESVEKYRDSPMYNIIDFSDCDGFMDNSTCFKLATDFKKYRNKFIAYLNSEENNIDKIDIEDYISLYDNFKDAFETGSKNGILIFM